MSLVHYSEEEATELLTLYQCLFPKEGENWKTLATYWDHPRGRPWSCLTTDFHTVLVENLGAFDAERRAWRSSGQPEEDGKALAALSSNHGCGFSLGISPWTDSALHATVTKKTRALIALVGHDWYPIVPKRGAVEARPPMDIFPLLDSTDPLWGNYTFGMPPSQAFRHAGIGLLFLNLVPDFRPPGSSAKGKFPFFVSGFNYENCMDGILAALKSANALFPINDLVVWGDRAWKSLRKFSGEDVARFPITHAAKVGGEEGYAWNADSKSRRIHPFPHPSSLIYQQIWTPEVAQAYGSMWRTLLKMG